MTEDQLEQETLQWLAQVGYTVKHGLDIAPDGSTPLRSNYQQVLLQGAWPALAVWGVCLAWLVALALALNVRLAKPGVYTLHSKGRRAGPLDTRRAARLGTQVVLAMVPVVAGLQLLVLVGVAWAHA